MYTDWQKCSEPGYVTLCSHSPTLLATAELTSFLRLLRSRADDCKRTHKLYVLLSSNLYRVQHNVLCLCSWGLYWLPLDGLRLRFSRVFPLTVCAIQIYLLTYLIRQRFIYKLSVLTYKALQTKEQYFLADLTDICEPSRCLWSTNSHLLDVPSCVKSSSKSDVVQNRATDVFDP